MSLLTAGAWAGWPFKVLSNPNQSEISAQQPALRYPSPVPHLPASERETHDWKSLVQGELTVLQRTHFVCTGCKPGKYWLGSRMSGAPRSSGGSKSSSKTSVFAEFTPSPKGPRGQRGTGDPLVRICGLGGFVWCSPGSDVVLALLVLPQLAKCLRLPRPWGEVGV